MYDHTKQYRCIIIRGKAKDKLDDLLPAYAFIIDSVCPCAKDEFESRFNRALMKLIHAKGSDDAAIKKTLDNHRTEIAGKLFGMYYLSEDGVYYASERTKVYLNDNDQPAFFKDICFKMQFPNGMNKIQTIESHRQKKICIRQFPFIIKILLLAEDYRITLTVSDIGYYVLNSLDVLCGLATPEEVIKCISADKAAGIKREIVVPGKASSFTMQHIKEQINYLELANLVYIDEFKIIILNRKEERCLQIFADRCGMKPAFDMYSYDVSDQEGRDRLFLEWDKYYSKVSDVAGSFKTEVSSLMIKQIGENSENKSNNSDLGSTVELGDEGEKFVYNYEKARVAAFNPRLVNKVVPLGKTKGLGYDIQSVIAEKGDFAEFVKYIEVKSTKRVTAPNFNDEEWVDTLNITRNEWVAAMQHKDYYSIYRVYFVRDGVVVYILRNIYRKEKDGVIQVVPTMYRLDFSKNAIDGVIS